MSNYQTLPTAAAAPAKLILSGEHAVVYGAPALAIAVNRLATTYLSSLENSEDCFIFNLPNLNHFSKCPLHEILCLKKEVQSRYQQFIEGKILIQEVIVAPENLLKCAVAFFWEKFALPPYPGLSLTIDSHLPVGCGLGSSAATLLSLLYALLHHFKIKMKADDLLTFARQIESLQHGSSSGLDLFLSLHGGCYYFNNNEVQAQKIPPIKFYAINTGKPLTSTGECVKEASAHFHRHTLIAEFAKITSQLNLACQENNFATITKLVKLNHLLLQDIGVVPAAVAKFINEIETKGLAAKISGAGATSGSAAGIVIIFGEEPSSSLIENLVKKYGYEDLNLCGENSGVRPIST